MNKLIKNQNDYLEETSSDLQNYLGIKDTKLLTTGPLSVLANLLSNISFDAQKYYEYITKEFNVATAQYYKSMLFHASVYSYNLKLALPATVSPVIEIPVANVSENQLVKYTIPLNSVFILNKTQFRINGEVDIIITPESTSAVLTQGSIKYNLSMTSVMINGNSVYHIRIPSEMVEQVDKIIEKFVVPEYKYGESVTFNMQIPKDNQLYKLKAFLNSYNKRPVSESKLEPIMIDHILEKFNGLIGMDIKYFKFNSGSTDNVIFQTAVSPQNVSFTLGNGIYGRKLHVNDEVIVVAEYTKGSSGNVSPGEAQLNDVQYYKINSKTNETLVFNSTILKVITLQPATGGKNEDDIEDIRFGILKKITERESLVTQLDFQKYFADPVTHQLACVVSRQLNTVSPFVTVYNVLKNPYDYSIEKTVTLNKPSKDCFTDTQSWIVNPTMTYNNSTVISPFIYIHYNDQVWSFMKYDQVDIPLSVVKIQAEPAVTPKLSVVWDSTDQYFYFQADITGIKLPDTKDDYIVTVETKMLGTYKLNKDNNFRAKITSSATTTTNVATDNNVTTNVMILKRFFKNDLVISKVYLGKKEPNTISMGFIEHIYSVSDSITIMKKIQRHPEYIFTDVDPNVKKVLFMPFINQDYFNKMKTDVKYLKNITDFFIISNPELNLKKAFNISLNQSFMNTIKVDNTTALGVMRNDNIVTTTKVVNGKTVTNSTVVLDAEYKINIKILINMSKMEASGLTLFDLRNDIQLAVLDFFNKVQGNSVKYYDTALVKMIKNIYPDIILEVKPQSPKSLVVQEWSEILEENNLTANGVLATCPTYFYFDINNLEIDFQIG